MPALQPIQNRPRTTSDLEADSLVALRALAKPGPRPPGSTARVSALGRSLAGRTVRSGITGGSFIASGAQRTAQDAEGSNFP